MVARRGRRVSVGRCGVRRNLQHRESLMNHVRVQSATEDSGAWPRVVRTVAAVVPILSLIARG